MANVTLAEWENSSLEDWRTRWLLPELHFFESVASTNDIIKQRAQHGAPAGATGIAELQTHGRGRRDRRWDAPSGTALLMSMLFRPTSFSPADFAGTLPLRVGMAAARAIERVTGLAVRLKWPNDLLAADGRKIGGILCESSLSSTGITFTVVGIGINVLQTVDELHYDARNNGVSLRMLMNATNDGAGAAQATAPSLRRDLATALIAELLPLASMPAAALSSEELAEFADRDPLSGHDVTADGEAVGTADGISALGELRVRAGDAVRSIHAGTIRTV